jgi:hypothetical protein
VRQRDCTLVIGDWAALAALPAMPLRQRPTRLKLALPGLRPLDRAQAEARLARRLSACGCNEAALALLVSLPLAAALSGWLADGAARWAWGLGGVVLGAALGKALGLWRARAALRAEVAAVAALAAPGAAGRGDQGSPSQ